MIEFTTLFLALALGRQPVEIVAAEPVAAIELYLDGVEIARLESPPWKGEIDLGNELLPHELAAVALDAEGKKVGEARQWVNYSREQVESRWAADPAQGWPPKKARLLWQSFDGEPPKSIEVTFDGKPLKLEEGMQVDLGDYDASDVHSLEAVLAFEKGLTARAVLSLGGVYSEEVSTALTAIPLLLPEGFERPSPEEVAGWLRHASGEPLSIHSLGTEGPVVLIVRDRLLRLPLPIKAADQLQRATRELKDIRRETDLYFLDTTPRMLSLQGVETTLFKPFKVGERWSRRGVYHVARRLAPQPPRGRVGPEPDQMLHESLAIAGKLAGQSGRRRAVLLLRDPTSLDASTLFIGQVERFLQALRVPYFVWVADRDESLGDVVNALEGSLERQLVVWLDGQLLPQHVELTKAAPSGLTFAGAEEASP